MDFGKSFIENGYFAINKYSALDIGQAYNYGNWARKLVEEMTKIYGSVGISGVTGGTEGTAGDVSTLTVGDKTYKNYKQIKNDYKKIKLACYPNTTLYASGCAITSDAIVGSGFGSDLDPIRVNQMNSNNHSLILSKLTNRNWEDSKRGGKNSFDKAKVIQELEKRKSCSGQS